jgi:hypothetical protein
MPNFRDCLGTLLENIMKNRIAFTGLSKYIDMIGEWGGKNAVMDDVLRCIEPTLLGHTGEKITPDMYVILKCRKPMLKISDSS